MIRNFIILANQLEKFEDDELYELYKSFALQITSLKCFGFSGQNNCFGSYPPKTISELRHSSETKLIDFIVKEGHFDDFETSFIHMLHALTLATRYIQLQTESANNVKDRMIKHMKLKDIKPNDVYKINTFLFMVGTQRAEGAWYAIELQAAISKYALANDLNPYDFSSLGKKYIGRVSNFTSEFGSLGAQAKYTNRSTAIERLEAEIEKFAIHAREQNIGKQKKANLIMHTKIVERIFNRPELITYQTNNGEDIKLGKELVRKTVINWLNKNGFSDLVANY